MSKYEVFNNNKVVEELVKDFKGISLSFIKESDECEYLRFKKVEELQEELFNNINKNPLTLAYIPIVGMNRVKWFTNEITGSPVLVVMVKTYRTKRKLTFLGIRKES